MKRTAAFFLLVTAMAIPASCLEPVGYSVPFSMSSAFSFGSATDVEEIAFPGTSFVKVHLSELVLGAGDSIELLDGERSVFFKKGPFDGRIWLPSVRGGSARIVLRSGGAQKPRFTVDEVGVGYASEGGRTESVCGSDDRRNAVCYDSALQGAADPVGRMLFTDGGGWYACTGSLVSSNGHFITNNHCIDSQITASSLEVYWRYQSPTCTGSSSDYDSVTTGSQLVTTDQELDFSLLQLDDISTVQKYGYLQLANRQAVQGETIWIPQHGGGTIKRFAVVSDMDGGGNAKVVDASIAGYGADTDIGYWADTEGGSSGSPVLDSQNKMIAIHHFGLPYGFSCDQYYMNQGVKMSLIYPLIAQYLGDPIPPQINGISKATDPFRLIVTGDKFQTGITVTIGSTPWSNVSYKNSAKLVLKGGTSLKSLFPKGTPVTITFTNPDGGVSYSTYTR